MIKNTYIIIVLSALLLSACVGPGHINSGYKVREHPYHLVQKGDTLYSIAWQAGHDYRKVARWNNIRWPYQIHPGQRIYLSPAYYYEKQQLADSTAQQPRTVATAKATSPVKSHKNNKKTHSSKRERGVSSTVVRWQWPVKGKVISYFSAQQPGKNGLDIAGRAGQAVKAAASGRVVYSGSGLRGYGNLVIIKHNETYFSAYAHNRKIYVKENQKVKSGEKIADMGSTGTNRIMLHFEIRKNGRPIDPLKYLPKT